MRTRLRRASDLAGRLEELLPLDPAPLPLPRLLGHLGHEPPQHRRAPPDARVPGAVHPVRRPRALVHARRSAGGPLAAAGLVAWHVAESGSHLPPLPRVLQPARRRPVQRPPSTWSTAPSTGARTCPGSRRGSTRNAAPGEDVYLAYFGTGEPRYYGLKVKRLAYINGFHEDEPYIPLGPGLYCVGATMLEQVYSTVRGPWTDELEKEYQFLRTYEPTFRIYERTRRRGPSSTGSSPPRNGGRAATGSCTCASRASATTCASAGPTRTSATRSSSTG